VNPLAILKSKLAMVIVAVILIGVIASAGLLQPGDLTSGEAYSWEGVKCSAAINDTTVATSWKSDGLSQSVAVVGYAKFTDRLQGCAVPKQFRWLVYVNGVQYTGAGTDWANTPWTAGIGGVRFGVDVPMNTYQFTLRGTYVGELKVYLEVKLSFGVWPFVKDKLMDKAGGDAPWDGARLESAASTLFISGNTNIVGDSAYTRVSYEAGDNFVAEGQTGYSGDGKWYVKMYAPADRADLANLNGKVVKQVGDDQTFTVSVTIGANWYSSTSTNQFKLELWNNLWSTVRLLFFSIDDYALAPTAPVMKIVVDGGSATINLASNSPTAAVVKFQVMVWYGSAYAQPPSDDTGSWILHDVMLTATATGNNYTASATFNVRDGYSGKIAVEAIAIDSGNRHSDKAVQSAIVDNGHINPPTPPKAPVLFHWTLAAILAIVLTLLFAALAFYLNKKKPNKAMTLALIIGVMGAIITYYIGITPDLAYSMGTTTYFSLRALMGAFL
jgi:hypothetical protein